tara:strand:- start:8625 stop:9278 length:654 start_codon:yes stop_codon:yes gene_type:complete
MKSFKKYMSEGNLDAVNKKALKGKHADRKDKDIDNDGDVDSSDKYLHKRRKAISKAVTNEEAEEIEEGESGLWANINKKRKRIKNGSGEKMRKPGSDGAPTNQDFKDAAESVEEGTVTCPKCNGKGCEHCDGKGTHTDDQQIDEFVGKAIGGAVKMIAKGVRNTVTDKQGNVRGTKAARADSAEAKANKAEKKVKDAKRIKDAQARLSTARKKAQEK